MMITVHKSQGGTFEKASMNAQAEREAFQEWKTKVGWNEEPERIEKTWFAAIAWCEARAALSADPVAVEPAPLLTKERLLDIINAHLTDAYACTRVWNAWNVGTMTQEDFTPLSECEFPDELADAILATQPVAVGGRKPLTPRQYNMALSVVPKVPPSAYEDATRAIEAAHGIRPHPKAGEPE